MVLGWCLGVDLVMVCVMLLEVLLVVLFVFVGMLGRVNCSLTPHRVLVETGVCTQVEITSLQPKLVLQWDSIHSYLPASKEKDP